MKILSPTEIEESIVAEGKHLREMTDKIHNAARCAAEAETAFKVTFAKERLIARAGEGKITEAFAEDTATVNTEAQRLAYLIESAKLTALREELRITTARIDALRTLSASIRNVT